MIEEWHVAGEVVAHRGDTDWLDEIGPMLSGSGRAAGAPVLVMTTAGYVVDEHFDMDRALDFVSRTGETRRYLEDRPSNRLTGIFNSPPGEQDGITLTAWDDAPSFIEAAYRTGTHAENLERNRQQPMFDRSSFTRINPISSRGAWAGIDPLAD